MTDPVLLPQPRSMVLSDETVDEREPTVSRDQTMRREGYRLRIGSAMVDLTAADDAGEAYGRATLAQLAARTTAGSRSARSTTGPTCRCAAVMLDISRDKVPTMETLRRR